MLLTSEIAEMQRIATRSFHGQGACTITRPGEDERAIDTESGQPIGDPPADVEVYAGDCFVDERGETVAREQGGDPDVAGKAVIQLPAEAAVFNTEADALVAVFSGVTRSGRILSPMYMLTQIRLLVTWETLAEAV